MGFQNTGPSPFLISLSGVAIGGVGPLNSHDCKGIPIFKFAFKLVGKKVEKIFPKWW